MFSRNVTSLLLSLLVAVSAVALTGRTSVAQTPATAAPAPVPSKLPTDQQEREKKLSAKQLFGEVQLPSPGRAMAIGFYHRGCLAGAVELPLNGPTWQVMRVSRNRNWGHPSLINFVEKFANDAAKATDWKGILVGDLGQPRGGPSPSDHASHQVGLDADIWFMPMPDRVLTKEERDTISAINLVADDWKHLNPKTWTPQHVAFIKAAAKEPNVERVLVNAVIKKELCRVQTPKDHAWMAKVRPWYGHHDHIHVRLACPPDSPACRPQTPVTGSDGCSAKELDYWVSDKVLHPQLHPTKPTTPPKPVMLADLPAACKTVLEAPDKKTSVATDKH